MVDAARNPGWSPPTSTAPWSAPTARVSDRTRDVLARLERRGVPVVFVTGRPLRWAEEVFEYVGDHGLAVVSNGALVWDVAADRCPGSSARSTPELGLEVCAALRAAVPGTSFAVETLAGIGLEPAFLERHPVPDGARPGPIEELFDRPALKLLARHEELAPQEFWDLAEAAVGDRLVDHLVVGLARCSRSAPPASPRPPRSPCSATTSASTPRR